MVNDGIRAGGAHGGSEDAEHGDGGGNPDADHGDADGNPGAVHGDADGNGGGDGMPGDEEHGRQQLHSPKRRCSRWSCQQQG